MAITNGYATLSELKARMGIPVSDTADDSILEAVIEASSRSIDRYTGRQFFQSVAQTRYFTPASEVLVFVDDLLSYTAVATDRNLDRTWSHAMAASDLELGPLNNPTVGFPYTEIRLKPLAGDSFDLGLEQVKVTGTWGWTAVPDLINESCLLLSSRLFRRKDAPFGIAGGGDVGQSIALRGVDPDVQVLLSGYRKLALTELV